MKEAKSNSLETLVCAASCLLTPESIKPHENLPDFVESYGAVHKCSGE